jgi:serine/threonine protein kinase
MWDALLNYGFQHKRWFEPASQYSPGPEFLAILGQHEGSPRPSLLRHGLWFICNPEGSSLVQQGWKLHVSATPSSATDVLTRALPILCERRVPFKFLLDRATLVRTSGKRWPRSSSGKFITVYPANDEEFLVIAKELTQALAGTTGPFILSDRRVPGSDNVFYRYGGFKALPELQPDGTSSLMISDPDGVAIPDLRTPFYSKPAWARDPFGEQEPSAEIPTLDNGRFSIITAVSYSNAGGVYKAMDEHTGAIVIVKEARPHILVGRPALDAQDMLRKEYEILGLLADTGHFVRPVTLFTQWEHLFLVEEFIDGQQMSTRSIPANPILNGKLRRQELIDYYREQQRHWLALLDALDAAHRRNVVLADLSFANVLHSSADDRLVIIDLEAAVRIGQDELLGLHTPGVSSPRIAGSGDADFTTDYYSLGALMLGSVMLVNAAVGYHPPLLEPFLDELAADLALPSQLPAIIMSLMRPEADTSPDPAALRAQIAALDFDGHQAWHQPIPLSLAARTEDGLSTAELDQLIDGTTALIRSTADPRRSDRLFPSYITAFEANPHGVAYGAAGVLHVLYGIDKRVDDPLLGWLLAGDWSNPKACPPGLYSGTAGIAWVLDELGYSRLAESALGHTMRHPLLHAESGILNGSAGIGLACLRLAVRSTNPKLAQQALSWAVDCGSRLADEVVLDERGAHWLRKPYPGSPKGSQQHAPIGYGHGASGIALFLLYLSLATGERRWCQLGRAGLDHDLSWGRIVGNELLEFPATTHDPETSPKITRSYWDEGTAGVATALLRFRAVADDDALRQAWAAMRPDLCRKYVVLPQLFHGLAGIGMALQDAAELIGDEAAGLEAGRLARGLALFAVPREDGIAWPSEQCFRESSDLATGAAGVAMFLHRLRTARQGNNATLSTNTNFVLDELLATGWPSATTAPGGRLG